VRALLGTPEGSGALALPTLAPAREELLRLLEDYARGHRLADAPLRVALVGATGAGKSTLLNALAGASLAQEGEARPTSREVTVYAPEGAPLEGLLAPGARVERYRPGAAAGGWSGQTLVDTPDLNSVERVHAERTARALEACDVAVVVMHRGSVAEAVQADFLAGFASRRRLLFAVNYADEYGRESREALKEQVRRLAQERLGLAAEEVPVFAISAREARAGRDVTGEFGALLLSLRALGGAAVAERVRQGNAAAALRALAERVGAGLAEAERVLGQVRGGLAEGLQSARALLREEFEGQLLLASGELAQAVRKQAAGRGWGPAALWMRLSLLGAGGVGAATLVARASLPAGLAVAAGATLVDAVRSRTRAAAARERVLGPGPGEAPDGVAERAARAALAPPRTAAAAAGLPAEQAGLPPVEALAGALQRVREEAWEHAERGAVGAAVAAWWRWARWVLLPLINLPLLALLGHVSWRVVRAYVEGPLLPGAYFYNAAALASVLAMVGGTLASWSLAGAVRRVRAEALARLTERLEAQGEALLAETGGALGGPREDARALLALVRPPGAEGSRREAAGREAAGRERAGAERPGGA
jgi:energy-coupling factor transporter ATP-binding protein EcfA2